MRLFACLFFILLSNIASAEYRVFRLVISQRTPAAAAAETATAPEAQQAPAGRELISTLDPDQYPSYYQVRDDEFVSYTETWMCKGRTGNFKEPCPNPKTAAPVATTEGQAPAPATSSNTP